MPGFPAGRFGFREGQFTASSDSVTINVVGRGGHGSSLGDRHTGAGRLRCAHVQSNKCTTTDDLFVINQLACTLCRTK